MLSSIGAGSVPGDFWQIVLFQFLAEMGKVKSRLDSMFFVAYLHINA